MPAEWWCLQLCKASVRCLMPGRSSWTLTACCCLSCRIYAPDLSRPGQYSTMVRRRLIRTCNLASTSTLGPEALRITGTCQQHTRLHDCAPGQDSQLGIAFRCRSRASRGACTRAPTSSRRSSRVARRRPAARTLAAIDTQFCDLRLGRRWTDSSQQDCHTAHHALCRDGCSCAAQQTCSLSPKVQFGTRA